MVLDIQVQYSLGRGKISGDVQDKLEVIVQFTFVLHLICGKVKQRQLGVQVPSGCVVIILVFEWPVRLGMDPLTK